MASKSIDIPSVTSNIRRALGELIGSNAVDLSEGLGRLLITTSGEMSAPGFGQIPLSALTSVADVKGSWLEDLIEEQRAIRTRGIESIGEVDDCAIVRKRANGQLVDQWNMILRDASEEGKWRIQEFDSRGFSGHVCFATKELAIEEAASNGYSDRDDMALDRIQNTPSFQRGMFTADLIARINSGKMTHAEGDRRLAQYDELASALQSINASSAQAFITRDTKTICLLADRIQPGSEKGVFLHEIVHRHGLTVLGKTAWNSLVGTIKKWNLASTGSVERIIYDRAQARATNATTKDESLFDEELFAYGVEEAVALGVSPRASAHPDSAEKWLETVVNTLNDVVSRILGNARTTVDSQQIVDIAYALAQIENPERMTRILERIPPEGRSVLEGVIARSGAPSWYSQLEMRLRMQRQERMPASHWSQWIKAQVKQGVKPEEIHWSGVCDWLSTYSQEQLIERREVLSFIERNGIQLEEVIYSTGTNKTTEMAHTLVVELSASGFETRLGPDSEFVGVVRRRDGKAYNFDPNDKTFIADDGEMAPSKVQKAANAYALSFQNGHRTSTDVKFNNYTLVGGAEYSEMLLTLPMNPQGRMIEKVAGNSLVGEDDKGDAIVSGNTAEIGFEVETTTFSGQDANFKSPHWGVPNVVAHVRFNVRKDINDRKVLFIEEIQSDWAEQGRVNGFITHERDQAISKLEDNFKQTQYDMRSFVSLLVPGATKSELDAAQISIVRFVAQYNRDYRLYESDPDLNELVRVSVRNRIENSSALKKLTTNPNLMHQARALAKVDVAAFDALTLAKHGLVVPLAPFVGSTKAWVGLIVKRMIRYAVDKGFDSIAFINGHQSAMRYELVHPLDHINFEKMEDGKSVYVLGLNEDEVAVINETLPLSKLEGRFGSKIAEEIINGGRKGELVDLDAEVGGEGMLSFYDQVLPRIIKGVINTFGQGNLKEVQFGEKTGFEEHFPADGKGIVIRANDDSFYAESTDGAWTKELAYAKRFELSRGAQNAIRTLQTVPNVQVGFDITPKMREMARMGMPLFSLELTAAVAQYADGGSPDLIEAQLQCAEVVSSTISTDMWMKAPNGLPTKLTQSQWILVRTANFKKWFGDWEMLPDQSSQAIDGTTLEPMVMYHGTTKAGFAKFETGLSRQSDAIFFTSDRDVARSYAGTPDEAVITAGDVDEDGYPLEPEEGIYSVFLNIRKPHFYDFEGANWEGSRPEQWMVVQDEEDEESPVYDESGKKYFAYDEKDQAQALADSINGAMVVPALDSYETTNSIVHEAATYGNDGALMYDVVDEGHFGTSSNSSHVFAVFDARQVKSATSNVGTFDGSRRDIRHSLPSQSTIQITVPDTVKSFTNALKPFKDAIYHELIVNAECGPFDGGCVVFAQALQRVIGGKIVVVTKSNDQADHAAVLLKGKLYDFDGPLRPDRFFDRFGRNEHVQISGFRPINETDLPDAIRNANLENVLTAQLEEAFGSISATLDRTDDIVKKSIPQEHTAAFRRWFAGSVTKNANGHPMVMYHSTVADFNKFRHQRRDIGFHFGTDSQAKDRFLLKIENDPYGPELRGVQHSTMPVYLAIKRPLRLDDLGPWDRDELCANLPAEFTLAERLKTSTVAEVRELIKNHGYDGIVYKNTGETGGAELYRAAMARAKLDLIGAFGSSKTGYSIEEQKHPLYVKYVTACEAYRDFRLMNAEDSWIAFDPHQVKSAIGNRGTFSHRNGDIRFSLDAMKDVQSHRYDVQDGQLRSQSLGTHREADRNICRETLR